MKRLVIALAALLLLAGCATPYGYSPGAWAYYDANYDSGQEGYDRPITYYGESAAGLPYGNPGYVPGYVEAQPIPEPVYPVRPQPPHYFEQPYDGADYAGAPVHRAPAPHCHCTTRPSQQIHASQAPKPAHDSSWYSTYYSVGP